jgi:predicted adenylyl cyclase CyaB
MGPQTVESAKLLTKTRWHNMARNVEIKARIESIEALFPRAAVLADSGPTTLHQDDMFFPCPNGRMKLRKFSDTEGELIFYQRPDRAAPKESFYVRVPTTSPDSLREALGLAYGVIGRVHKDRTLFMLGKTRIHLDRVAGLGDFLELEVVLADGETFETATVLAEDIMDKLHVSADQLVSCAYVDLLAKAAQKEC